MQKSINIVLFHVHTCTRIDLDYGSMHTVTCVCIRIHAGFSISSDRSSIRSIHINLMIRSIHTLIWIVGVKRAGSNVDECGHTESKTYSVDANVKWRHKTYA